MLLRVGLFFWLFVLYSLNLSVVCILVLAVSTPGMKQKPLPGNINDREEQEKSTRDWTTGKCVLLREEKESLYLRVEMMKEGKKDRRV